MLNVFHCPFSLIFGGDEMFCREKKERVNCFYDLSRDLIYLYYLCNLSILYFNSLKMTLSFTGIISILFPVVAEMKARGQEVPRDAFGHVKLDAINPGKWFGDQFGKMIGAEKVLVQKSGYFARAAAANAEDLRLIKSCVDLAVECALRRESGVIGHDEDRGGVLRAIEFERIKGGKPFDVRTPWYAELLREIGQPSG